MGGWAGQLRNFLLFYQTAIIGVYVVCTSPSCTISPQLERTKAILLHELYHISVVPGRIVTPNLYSKLPVKLLHP